LLVGDLRADPSWSRNSMVRTQVANEQTPLTDATRQKPSLELAMTRSRLRLLRSPEGTPWSLWGITAPFASFALLGAGPAAQVRIAGECVYLFAFLCVFGFPLYLWNYRPEHSLEANTAAGWGDLRWGQALLDFAISTTFVLFIMYNQFRLLDGSVYKTVKDRLSLPDVPDGLRVRQVVSKVKEAVERTLPDAGGDNDDAPPALPTKAKDATAANADNADEVDLDLAMEMEAMEQDDTDDDAADDGYLDTSNTKGLAFQIDSGDASLRLKSTRRANPLYRESKMDV